MMEGIEHTWALREEIAPMPDDPGERRWRAEFNRPIVSERRDHL
jgi:hypothetical protein